MARFLPRRSTSVCGVETEGCWDPALGNTGGWEVGPIPCITKGYAEGEWGGTGGSLEKGWIRSTHQKSDKN